MLKYIKIYNIYSSESKKNGNGVIDFLTKVENKKEQQEQEH